MITYRDDLERINSGQLTGFFQGWPDPPSTAMHLRILHGSDEVVLAIETETDQIVGFITAITDGVLSAYISLLEVLPEYRGRGIGSELARRMLTKLEQLYMIDLLCDAELQSFYQRFNMRPATGMMIRNRGDRAGE